MDTFNKELVDGGQWQQDLEGEGNADNENVRCTGDEDTDPEYSDMPYGHNPSKIHDAEKALSQVTQEVDSLVQERAVRREIGRDLDVDTLSHLARLSTKERVLLQQLSGRG